MSVNPREMESKAQMLVNEPGYVIPPDIQGLTRTRIEGRADDMRQNNDIPRFNSVPAELTQEPSTMGGKSKKNKKSKKSKKNKKNKTRR
jgi:hypothetical protein